MRPQPAEDQVEHLQPHERQHRGCRRDAVHPRPRSHTYAGDGPQTRRRGQAAHDLAVEDDRAGPDETDAAQVGSGIGFIGAGTIIIQKQFVRGLTTAAGIWATAGIGLAVGSGMYGLGIAATLLTLAGLELLSVIFKSIGMRSSLVVFSTSDKEAINRIARVIYEKGFLLVSYDMKRLGHQEKDEYVVSIVLKARKNTEESPLLLLMEQFPEVTVERIE